MMPCSKPQSVVDEELRQRVHARIEELLERAGAHFGERFALPRVRFDIRGRVAGEARMVGPELRFNPALLARYPDDFLAQTVPHEVAHLVVFARHGRGARPHGPAWRAVMALFGVPPRRCHSYDAPPARTLREYDYACGCQRHRLTSIRHNRVLRGQTYVCRRCHGPLRTLG